MHDGMDKLSLDDDVKSVDSLALPKRQKVFEKTFLPAGETLPVWSAVPLDHKIPVPPSPRGTFTFYTNKVGEPKYINRQRLDFDLTNPQGREAPGEYDSLQDPSLKTYFTSPRTKRLLVDNGLVTHRGEIVCNVKEFNEYRSFVRYRSVTELSLMKKKEKRVQQEQHDQMFLDWPNIHTKKRGRRDKRQVYSEPPRHRSEPVSGLDMYKEDLSAGLRRSEMIRRRDEMRKSGRTPIGNHSPRRRETSSYDLLSPRRRETPTTTPGLASPRRREHSSYDMSLTPRRAEGRSRNDSTAESQMFGSHKATLVEELRRREQQLKSRLEEQRKQREDEHRRKMEENWRERQARQEKLLQHEAEVEAKMKDERSQHILEREKTITQQWNLQEAKLKKIRQDMEQSRGGKSSVGHHSSQEDVGQEQKGKSGSKRMLNGDAHGGKRDQSTEPEDRYEDDFAE